MNRTWRSDTPPPSGQCGLIGWGRIALRGLAILLVMGLGLILLLLLRVFEVPIWRQQRPWTPHITVAVCRSSLWLLGLKYRVVGQAMHDLGAVVANHSTWLDILTLNACQKVYFVAKSEVAAWPVIGWLARATGTVFIRRASGDARMQKNVFETRLTAGHRLLFFPEGTSTDGTFILPFKSTLFAAFFTEKLQPILSIQPVTVSYRPPPGTDSRFYGWWGDMDLGPHLLNMLGARRHGQVTISFHAPLKVSDFDNRKDLAMACEIAVRSAFGGSEDSRT